jgi:hypothetical protein
MRIEMIRGYNQERELVPSDGFPCVGDISVLPHILQSLPDALLIIDSDARGGIDVNGGMTGGFHDALLVS